MSKVNMTDARSCCTEMNYCVITMITREIKYIEMRRRLDRKRYTELREMRTRLEALDDRLQGKDGDDE